LGGIRPELGQFSCLGIRVKLDCLGYLRIPAAQRTAAATIIGVSGELVRKVNGNFVFGEAVTRVAETLSPFSAAARMVTEVAAVAVEVRKLQLEGKRIEAEQMESQLTLRHRNSHVGKTLKDMHQTVNRTDNTAREYLALIGAVQREMLKRGVPLADKEIYLRILETHTGALISNHVEGGSMLTAQMHEVLGGDAAPGPARARPSPPGAQDPRSTGSRRNRGNSRNRSRRSR
jgi:hypothetical protein